MSYNKLFEEKTYILLIPSILVCLIPFALSTGPFLPDLFLSLVSIIFLITSIYKRLWKYYLNPIFMCFLLFWMFITLVSLNSENIILSLKPSITYIRFGVFCTAVIYLINNNKNFLNFFFKTLIASLVLVILYAMTQISYGESLITHPKSLQHIRPYWFINVPTGFFGDEKILGSYLSKLYPLFIVGIIYLNNLKKFTKTLSLYAITLLIFFIICFTHERSAFFFIILTLFTTTAFTNVFQYKKVFFLLLTLTAVVTFVLYPTMFEVLITNTLKQLNIIQGVHHQKSEGLFLFSNIHEGHYSIAINIFKDNPLFGAGVKMFRELCPNYTNIINYCSTHPHNTYVQLLAETGIVGFAFVFSILIYIVYQMTKHIYSLIIIKKNYLGDYNFALTVCFLITLWPIIPTGNFFNNWLSVSYFLPVGFYLCNSKYYKFKNYD